jgi:hypothetical protein
MKKIITLDNKQIEFIHTISIKIIKLLCWIGVIFWPFGIIVVSLVFFLANGFVDGIVAAFNIWFPDFKSWLNYTFVVSFTLGLLGFFGLKGLIFIFIYSKTLKFGYTGNWKHWCKVSLFLSGLSMHVSLFVCFLLYYLIGNDKSLKELKR